MVSLISFVLRVLTLAPIVGRAKKRRNVQRPPCQLRQFHEHHVEGGVPDKFRGRQILEVAGMLYQRKYSALVPSFACWMSDEA